jgi:hypothetical protein
MLLKIAKGMLLFSNYDLEFLANTMLQITCYMKRPEDTMGLANHWSELRIAEGSRDGPRGARGPREPRVQGLHRRGTTI